MMYSNVIVGITISRGSFVFSQSRVKVSASLNNVGSLAVKSNAPTAKLPTLVRLAEKWLSM